MLELPSPGASHCVKRPPTPSLLPGLCPSCFLIIVLDPCWSLFAFLIPILVHVPDLFFCCCFFPRSPPALRMWSDQHLPRLTMPAFTTLLLDYTSLQLHNNHLPAPPKPHSPRLLCQQRVVLCRFTRVALRCAEDWARLVCPREDARRNIVSRARGIPDGTLPPPPSITLCKVILPISGVSISPLWQKFQSTMVVSTYLATLWFHSHFCFFLAP